MKQFIESILNVTKNIANNFEELISDQNKMTQACQLILFVNSKNYILQYFSSQIFTRYVNLFQSKHNESVAEFMTIISKLRVQNMKIQVNEIHIHPANSSIIE